MLRALCFAAALLIGTATTQTADAAEETRWYGYQTLAADGAAVALAATAIATESYPLAWSSLAVFAAGAPVIHGLHGQTSRGLGSLAMRVGAPLALGAAAYGIAQWSSDLCDNGGYSGCESDRGMKSFSAAAVTAMITMGLVIVVDAAVLAHEPVGKIAPRNDGPTVTAAPWFTSKEAGAALTITL